MGQYFEFRRLQICLGPALVSMKNKELGVVRICQRERNFA
jgi:hypothetical protein